MATLAACGGSDAEEPANRPAPDDTASEPVVEAGGQIEIRMPGYYYAPSRFTIPRGEEVTVLVDNRDGMEHTFTIDDLDVDVRLSPRQETSFTLVVDEPGTYTFYCRIAGHMERGQIGTLTVE